MLGVSMQRLCPDQTATEAARKAYVSSALYEPPAAAKKAAAAPKKGMSVQDFRKRSSGSSR